MLYDGCCCRVEYTEKSKHLSEHLRELKSEIEVLKKEDTDSIMDKLHEESVMKGENKYSTLRTVSILRKLCPNNVCNINF